MTRGVKNSGWTTMVDGKTRCRHCSVAIQQTPLATCPHEGHARVHRYNIVANKNLNQRHKMEVLIHYSGGVPKCKCCLETHIDFLTVDHINGGGGLLRRTVESNRTYRWLARTHFPDGFRVLCMNCNWAKRFGKSCPHERIEQ